MPPETALPLHIRVLCYATAFAEWLYENGRGSSYTAFTAEFDRDETVRDVIPEILRPEVYRRVLNIIDAAKTAT